MFIFFIKIFSILIIGLCFSKPTLGSECLIHNKEYSYEYLYQSNDKSTIKENALNAYIYPIGKLKDYDTIRWDMIEIFDENYLLKSIKSSYYLCASNTKHGSLGSSMTRRILYTSVSSSYNCIWNIKKVKEDIKNIKKNNRTYLIWNSLYNEQLYAPTFLFKTNFEKRNIFLWRSKQKDSISSLVKFSHETDRFKWIIDCSTGTFLSI